ncbi:aldehyde dehydrogenase family protein [Myxococcus llanfairpwllgwyngyllgogerychwyrndrobwllllantysiliogogogochensis]|uniref:Aldehyde dehydrogenase family protein n=1 Tax=Myxococcus llanfairpwllgwyngyllgogerychwyrndrobwllllantysiliogogogochensis TaxID=2590453 RepID=A0A540WVZ8_9BACT|nr:aldehyde dehydrogenase family protein [Myxococcus llanfairpwllgwyngyllgogerychwyrndrobwllllantysiliogogogochensis]TQF13191.1 aldehyde dehydrogenase family protein [Myxococcus llanfairpwllgwyngyllgogerychwyrndrobwllllantysiliogogogochensis]
MQVYDKLYIHGEWVASLGTRHIDVLSASTEEVMGRIPEGTVEDVDRAVRAARAAFDTWSTRPVEERAALLRRLQAGLTARQDELARTITGELGMPIALSKPIQVGTPIAVTGTYVQLLQDLSFEEQVGNSLVVREPVGVVACITPWNYPLHQTIAKVAPALAAGCTVVLKPSEVAPLNAFMLAEILHEAGVPPGVFNLVSGTGPVVGEALVRHPEVDMVSFTGSTRAGRRVSEVAAATVKRVSLELGGKSASIILDDANLKTAVKRIVGNCFLNSGQTCTAHTRLLVPRAQHEEAVKLAAEVAAGFTLGDPFKGEAKLGPVISDAQRTRVREYIQQGIREGAKLVAGGPEQPEGLPKGYYVKPTVFANVTPEMCIAQEEIFGPVLAIMPYDDEDDAVRIANSTIYGLAGGVWSEDVERAKRVARRMRTGQVDINGGRFNPLAPFGGYRQSGHGRELGRYGLEEFQELKAMQL